MFAYVDKQVGLENVLIVLSADHGQPEIPGHLHERGIEKAFHFDTEGLDKQPAIAALKKRFGLGKELIKAFFQPYLYLDRDLITQQDLDIAEVERALAAELRKFKGVAYAVSSSALRSGDLPDNLMIASIQRNFHEKRSGDIFLVFEPNVFINDFDGLEVASTHGSPWRYDTHVPIIFMGPGIEPKKVHRLVHPVDVAPTIAASLGMTPPGSAQGSPLEEVFH